MSSPFVRLISSFWVFTMVVLLLPLKILLVFSSKEYLIAFLAGQSAGSLRMSLSSSHLLSVMVNGSGFVPLILYSLLLDILCGHWIPITFLSCRLRKLPRFPSCITVHFSLVSCTAGSGCQFRFPILFPDCVILCKGNSCQFFSSLGVFLIGKV